MSFLDTIFGRKEQEKELVLSLNDMDSSLSKDFEVKFQGLKEDANRLHQEFQSVADTMHDNLRLLELSTFGGQVDYELLQTVVAHRRSFIQKMRIMLDKLDRPMGSDFDSISNFSKSASSTISEANENTVLDYHFVKQLFEREADSTIKNFKLLNKISVNFENMINDKKDSLIPIRNIKNDLQLMRNEIENLIQKKVYAKNLENKLSGFNHELEISKVKLDEVFKSEAWHHFNQLLEKKRSLELELSALKSQFMQNISLIEKPLKKFENLVARGIVQFPNEKIIKKFVDLPFDTLIAEKYPDSINSILNMVQDNLSNGKIELKDREKSLVEIKWIVENNIFGSLLNRYFSLSDELTVLNIKIEELKISTIKNDIEKNIGDLKKEIDVTVQEMNNVANMLEKIKKSIDDRKINLENTMSLYTGSKITLNIN